MHLIERARWEVYGGESQNINHEHALMKAPKSRLVRTKPKKDIVDLSAKFCMGDSVFVLPEKETGIVYEPADDKGNVIVQIKGIKRVVKHNRIGLTVAATELYPPDYDFSIVFDTVQNRKTSHRMTKKHDPSLIIVRDEDI